MKELKEIQQREYEQQQLLEKLQTEVFKLEGENDQKEVAVGLALVTIAYLAPRGDEIVTGQVLVDDFIPASNFFLGRVIPLVKEFSNNEEEQLVLVARFLEWVISSFINPFKSALLRSRLEEACK